MKSLRSNHLSYHLIFQVYRQSAVQGIKSQGAIWQNQVQISRHLSDVNWSDRERAKGEDK